MPGFVFTCNANAVTVDSAVKRLKFDERYTFKRVHQHENSLLGVNAYETYPIKIFAFKNITILFEGYVYNQEISTLGDTFAGFCNPASWEKTKIKNWVKQADGEFVLIFWHHGLREVTIVNDAWGRLPVYYFAEGKSFAISREIAFLTGIKPSCRTEQIAVANTLLFGYPNQERSLWEGISRMPPNTMIRYDLRTFRLSVDKDFELNFNLSPKPLKLNPEKCISLLYNALETRVKLLPNPTLALSGGLDSRLLAAIVAKHKMNVAFVTYDDAENSAKKDIAVVEQLIESLGIAERHDFIKLEPVSQEDVDLLLQIKQGLNYPGMAFILPFLKYFKTNNLTHFTGDGGDKLFADLRPLKSLKSTQELIRYLLRTQAIMPLNQVAKLIGLSKTDILDDLKQTVSRYGASTPDEEFSQFLILERAMKWLFEGEDRNRYFSWCSTPYYNPELAREAMLIPMANKARGLLFHEMFRALPGNLHQLINPNWGLSLTNDAAIKRMFWEQKMRLYIHERLIRLAKGKPANPVLPAFLEAKLLIKQAELPHWVNQKAIMEASRLPADAQWQLTGLLRLWSWSTDSGGRANP